MLTEKEETLWHMFDEEFYLVPKPGMIYRYIYTYTCIMLFDNYQVLCLKSSN